MASSIRADADRAALLGLAVAIRLREGEGGRESGRVGLPDHMRVGAVVA